MATWDSADLLQRVRDLLNRPTIDQLFDDPKIYRWLTEAEAYWKPIIVAHYPDEMWSAPTLMTPAVDGKTFDFPVGVTDPIRFEVLESLTGLPLKRGAFWDPGSDYVLESGRIRITGGRSRSFIDGAPYVRYITAPGDIDASTESTINPPRLRALLAYGAAEMACRSGAAWGDPSYFEERAQTLAWGSPNVGDVGLIGQLKTIDHRGGMASLEGSRPWAYWRPNG